MNQWRCVRVLSMKINERDPVNRMKIERNVAEAGAATAAALNKLHEEEQEQQQQDEKKKKLKSIETQNQERKTES